jgi:hypothetical protein
VWSNDTRNKHDHNQVSVGDQDLRARSKSFSAVAGFFGLERDMAGASVAERIDEGVVSANFLSVPARRRPSVAASSKERISAARRRGSSSRTDSGRAFDADPRVIGRSLVLDGEAYR